MRYLIYFCSFVIILIIAGVYILMTPVIVSNSEFVQVDRNNLQKHLEYLTTGKTERSFQNPQRLDEVAEYIFNHFSQAGCDTVEYQKYLVDEKEYKNVLCYFEGKDTERIVVGAHYDVDANNHDNDDIGDALYQGADDNGSGTVGVLELASMLGKDKEKELKNSIELVAYTLEEAPNYHSEGMGSHVHAKSLKDENIEIKYMMVLEMIGYFSDEEVQQYPIPALKILYPKTGDFIALIGKIGESGHLKEIKKGMLKGGNINVYSMKSPSVVPGINRSDHWSYWQHGYEAYLLTDTSYLRNPHYHKVTDTLDTLDLEKMGEVIAGVYKAITE